MAKLTREDLEKMRADGDLNGLVAVTAGDDDKMRHAAAEMLGECGDARCVGPLVALLRQGRFAYQRGVAARSLGNLAAADAVPALIEALHDAVYYTRSGAARALGQIGDARAVVPLIATLKDDKEYVRWIAVDALTKFGGQAVPEMVRQVEADRGRGVETLAITLGKIGDPRALDVLRELAQGHPEPYVRQTAARAVQAIESPE